MFKYTATLSAVMIGLLGAETSVKVAGFQVVYETYGKSKFGAELVPLNGGGEPGMQIGLMFERAGGGMIDLDEKASKLTVFKDDQGTNLTRDKGWGDFNWPKVSEDGKAGMVRIETEKLPAEGSKEIHLKGTFVIKTGEKTRVVKAQEAIPLALGKKIKVGKKTFEITELGKASFGQDGHKVELSFKGSFDSLKEIQFLDKNGKKVKAEQNGSSYMGIGPLSRQTRTFKLETKPKKVVIATELWVDLGEEEVPFELKIGVPSR